MAKLTPWFPASVKPVHIGWYIASMFRDRFVYRYWDGEHWSNPVYGVGGLREAVAVGYRPPRCAEHCEWRGLASPPKESKHG